MPRRGENIFKRKDGRWEARYIKKYDVSGKAIYGYCYGKTYTEAKEKVTALKVQMILNHAPVAVKSKRKVSYYCDKWLDQHKTAIKPSTQSKYAMILDRYIKPRMGNCHPSALSTQIIENFKEELLKDYGLSAKTVRDILMVLKLVLTFIRKDMPGAIPEIEIIYPKVPKQEMRVLTTEEQKILVDYLNEEMDLCKFGIYLALTTGLRIGELCALHWSDISLSYRTVTVSATLQRVKNFNDANGRKTILSFGSPKSDSSSRTIPLTDRIIRLCAQFMPDDIDTFVLTGTTDFMEPRTLQYRFQHYMKICALEGVHFHTLRHTFATRCVEVGFETKSLSEVLGHASTTITLNRYVHSSMDLKRENMNKLSAAGF